jgi:catechol 2,3-dioxygenase-like lactoylglutathione lyase family enzyme
MEEEMFDHIGFGVSDYQRSKAFYESTLAPLGITLVSEHTDQAAGFGRDEKTFWVESGRPVVSALHVAFTVEERGIVDAFHAAGLEAGGTDNGGPGLRPIYHPNYYAAFILDPDGNNIEAVCHKPA